METFAGFWFPVKTSPSWLENMTQGDLENGPITIHR